MNYDLSNTYQKGKFLAEVDRLTEASEYVTLARVPQPRSGNQNRYLHALLGLMSVYTGYTLNEIKDTVKDHFAPRYFRGGREFVQHTSDMNKEDMTAFIDKVRNWGNSNGFYLPTVEEWQKNWREIDKEINSYKQGK